MRPREQGDLVTVVDHLSELRARLLWSMGWLLTAFVLCYWQRDHVFAALARPLDDRFPLQTFGVTEPFFMSISVCAQAAFVLVTPVLAWHGWRYLRPALAPQARRMIAALLVTAPLLFTAGVAFGYFVILGPAVQFLLGLGPEAITVVVRASDYYSFVSTTLLAVGATFCFPLLLLGLGRIGVVDSRKLRSSRKLAYVLMVLVAALLPTADPVSLSLEVLPLLALYELSILAVQLQERLMRRAAASADVSAA